MGEKPFQGQVLKMATTTSTNDSGLLGVLNPAFEEKTGATVKVLSKGTGAAIQTAIEKQTDLIFVHCRSAEEEFVSDGFGVNRRDVMYNDFVMVGPGEDPAGIRGMTDAEAALLKLKHAGEAGKVTFFSRGDQSGTHKEELSFWKAAGIRPATLGRGKWYVSLGKGMGDTLRDASTSKGYTLSDRGTFLKHQDDCRGLEILVEGPLKGGDPRLMNPYGIIAVNPAYNPEVNYELAMAYIAFVTSLAGQSRIEDYKLHGERLFIPDAK
jgi:tungstate transport system substrate-binding protein